MGDGFEIALSQQRGSVNASENQPSGLELRMPGRFRGEIKKEEKKSNAEALRSRAQGEGTLM